MKDASELRPHEIATGAASRADAWIGFIGTVRTP